uniref:Beta/gamma crystallin 'Greek key' domain-containing protein n=1 Tax=Anas platyrhynchos TaxID=8839 RepID=A0A8B9TK62_ANAPL
MDGAGGTMNRITVYERPDFEGLSREFTCDCARPPRVVGQPWIAYTEPKYEGEPHAFEEGEYPSVGRPNSFSALRLVHHDLGDPQITLYERPNFQGACKVVTEETNLAYGYFNDRVASHVVQRGVWLLYQHPGRGTQRGHGTDTRGRGVPLGSRWGPAEPTPGPPPPAPSPAPHVAVRAWPFKTPPLPSP